MLEKELLVLSEVRNPLVVEAAGSYEGKKKSKKKYVLLKRRLILWHIVLTIQNYCYMILKNVEDNNGKISKSCRKKFGRLTVMERGPNSIDPSGYERVQYWCQCDCGNPEWKLIRATHLRNGQIISCGCFHNEIIQKIGRNNKKHNTYDLESAEYAIGYTKKGEEFWFDKEDYELVKNYCWHYNSNGYLTARDGNNSLLLHRLVMHFPDGNIDHIVHPATNERKIDNRKSNLRIVTQSQNNMNSCIYSNNTSGTKGVRWNRYDSRWIAEIQINKKSIIIGLYKNKEDAILARKEAEKKYFGEYNYDANN